MNLGGYASPSTATRPTFNPSSGVVQSGGLAPLSVTSGVVSSGAVTGQGGGGYFVIASGTVARNDLGSGSIASGHYASGLLENTAVGDTLATVEAVSGFKAVCLTSGGWYANADAASGLRLPAIGICQDSLVSGQFTRAIRDGTLNTTMCSGWSGMVGKTLYVGSGGAVVIQSGLLSGMGWQALGIATSGGIMIQISPNVFSGAATVGILGAAKF